MDQFLVFVICVAFLCGLSNCVNNELYDILGVRRGASTKEIKRAYKALAREWHPDKNSDPAATDKFTKINEAYETLSNPEKRADYDNFGFTSAQDQKHRQHPFAGGFHTFDDFFSGGFGHPFGFGGRDSYNLDKFFITLQKYENRLQPDSNQTPCFIYVYSDFCFSCMRIEGIVFKFLSELEAIGLCVGVVHLRRSPGLANHLHVHTAPNLLGVISGRVSFYKSSGVSFQYMRDFVKSLFPSDTLIKLNDDNADEFLQGWKDNRVRAIFFGTRPDASLRFLGPAFYHRERIAFGHVFTHGSGVSKILKQFNINKHRESLLLWNEDSQSPLASITMQQLSRSAIDEVVNANRFLLLPRLSSQAVFDELCPQERHSKKLRLCVALVTKKTADHEMALTTFRKLVHSSKLPPERVRFTYIYEDVQRNIIQTLMKGNETRSKVVVEVVILWRTDTSKLQYEFLEHGWNLDQQTHVKSRQQLEKRLTEIINGDSLLPYRATIPEFYNEHMLGLLTRILYKLRNWSDRTYYYFTSYDGMTVLTGLAALGFIGTMALSMRKMAAAEAEQVQKERITRKSQKRPPSCSQDNQTIHLYEIRSGTYASLVSEADTGLTITVLVDENSRVQLMRTFAEIMQPYSRYSGLTFAFLQLEYYLDWYRHLLELSMDFKISLDNINNHNCIGTVLAINGYRKYYYIYHPKRARRWMRKHHGSHITKAVGFGESDSDSSEEDRPPGADVLFLNEVLSGLSIWLDRVFDGSVKKVRISYWPEICK